MNVGEMLRDAAVQLRQAGCDAPRLDAELLLMHVWRVSRTELIIRAHAAVPESTGMEYSRLLQRRMEREPLAYIIGEKEFWSRSFLVNADVLIPRPETEHLIEAVLEHFPDRQGAYHFCDIGTGSGIIAITLACEYPNAHIVATDISEQALSVAKGNARIHHVSEHIVFRQGDLWQALEPCDGAFDAILSNPPYIAADHMPQLEQELAYEPRHALTDEADGLKHLTDLLNGAILHLRPDASITACMIVETGLCGLPDTPATLSLEHNIHDLAGHARGGIYMLRH